MWREVGGSWGEEDIVDEGLKRRDALDIAWFAL